MTGEDVVSLCIPHPLETDPLYAKKMKLLNLRSIGLEVKAHLSSSKEDLLQKLDQLIQTSRILQLNETELYFVEDDAFGPFTPRNELESLNSVLSLINSSLLHAEDSKAKVLQIWRKRTIDMFNSIVLDSAERMSTEKCDSHAEELLFEWGLNQGVQTRLKISHFKGAGRGVVAAEDMNIGDTALEIPESFIISEDALSHSEIFKILKKIDGISVETMLLLWSMKERYNSNSEFKIYFDTLPGEFNTGLSFGIIALTSLEGTLLLDEILQAREHLRKQYDELCLVFTDYPEIFKPEHYTWSNFLWACELWYSNSMKVVFSDGKLKTCLVPVAGLLNHALCPHILHYGRVDQVTRTLKFNLSRPCKGGEQCYLGYGNYPSSHLITFYGFMPEGDNYYDVIPLEFGSPDDGGIQPLPDETVWTTHMVRGTWLSNRSNLYPCHGLPSTLLAHLRAILKDSGNAVPSEVPGQADCNDDHDKAVFQTMISIFVPMMEGLGESDEDDRENSSWDVKLALKYKDLQRRIISSVLSSCYEALSALKCP